jgi:hypothetical protein
MQLRPVTSILYRCSMTGCTRSTIRFLATNDEGFDYAPASIRPRGRLRIYGIFCRKRLFVRFILRMRLVP